MYVLRKCLGYEHVSEASYHAVMALTKTMYCIIHMYIRTQHRDPCPMSAPIAAWLGRAELGLGPVLEAEGAALKLG